MWKIISSCLLLVVQVAGQLCPLPGPRYPAPRAAAGSTTLDRASSEFISALKSVMHPDYYSSQEPAIDPDLLSFTVQVYSAHDSRPLFEYYHTATSARNNTIGVRNVDEDTVFRIASCSKLWTVLLLLIETGDASFHEPVVNYIPELREAIAERRSNTTESRNEVDQVLWEELTIGELASQMSGVGRQYGVGDLAGSAPLMVPLGFPELSESEAPQCALDPTCTRSQFISGILNRPPIVPTSSSPAYSNDAYQLLAYALETITGRPYQELVERRLIEPMGLSRSSLSKPDDKVGIIPGLPNMTFWDLDLGDVTPAGGIYSSTKDMSRLGRAILNHELLSPALTRRWLKPFAQTAELGVSVGAPFEILSLTQPRMISLYTKAGDIGRYSAMMGLSPDHDIGFTILAAGEGNTLAVMTLADLISKFLIPALDQVAKEEAHNSFAGTYSSAPTNSSLEVTTDAGPGLRVLKWTNNGKDILDALSQIQLGPPGQSVELRLFPTGLRHGGRLSFRSVRPSRFGTGPGCGPVCGPVTRACRSWMLVDGSVYGAMGVDEFVFETGEDGRAISASPRAMRVTLTKEV
ncbi:beta-lactamase/transpeptidase-like protein [Aspergillus carlsbadensis]|nr:beta-lactamase/transpeptidase-like protein [Aspergillus carlsbadensis]